MSELASAVCSITRTQRRRFFWAAWWTGAPKYSPFRKPDAADGGGRSYEAALAAAERIAQRHLTIIDPYWARAWKVALRGDAPPPPPSAARPRRESHAQPMSAWSLLGLTPGANLDEIKRAFQKRALETHPDQGGDSSDFRAVLRAYERLSRRPKARAPKR